MGRRRNRGGEPKRCRVEVGRWRQASQRGLPGAVWSPRMKSGSRTVTWLRAGLSEELRGAGGGSWGWRRGEQHVVGPAVLGNDFYSSPKIKSEQFGVSSVAFDSETDAPRVNVKKPRQDLGRAASSHDTERLRPGRRTREIHGMLPVRKVLLEPGVTSEGVFRTKDQLRFSGWG